jgi:peptide deformylase
MRLDPQFLHTKGQSVLWYDREKDKKKLQKHSVEMIALMIEEKGIGLAANQVGLNLQMFVMRKQDGDYLTCINPEIISIGTDWHGDIPMTKGVEGCLSFPDEHYEIKRPKTVTVEYTDYNSTKFTVDLEDWDARVWLHEYDHCQGITFDQRYNNNIKKEDSYDKA